MAWVLLACVFAAVWIYAFYREDRHNPEPVWMVLLAAAVGCAAFFVADRVENRFLWGPGGFDDDFWARARLAYLCVSPIEEGAKLLGVLLLVRPWTHFDEAMDGLVYAAAAGAGFALTENLHFMQDQPELVLARGPAGTAAHVFFALFWGGAMGFAGHVRSPVRQGALLLASFAVAVLAHGTFDLITFCAGTELTQEQGRALQIALLVLCLAAVRLFIGYALRLRPFRFRGGKPSRDRGPDPSRAPGARPGGTRA